MCGTCLENSQMTSFFIWLQVTRELAEKEGGAARLETSLRALQEQVDAVENKVRVQDTNNELFPGPKVHKAFYILSAVIVHMVVESGVEV